jgi:hypothetical protein
MQLETSDGLTAELQQNITKYTCCVYACIFCSKKSINTLLIASVYYNIQITLAIHKHVFNKYVEIFCNTAIQRKEIPSHKKLIQNLHSIILIKIPDLGTETFNIL